MIFYSSLLEGQVSLLRAIGMGLVLDPKPVSFIIAKKLKSLDSMLSTCANAII